MKKRISALVLAIAMLMTVIPTAVATEVADLFTTTAAPDAAPTAPAQDVVFTDIAGMYYEEAALRWAEYGVINGMGDQLFLGSGTATRGQAAKIIVLTAGLEVLTPPASFFEQFTDVPSDAWFAPYVYTLYVKGIMKGDGVSLMFPEKELTREEYVTLAGRAFGVAENIYGLTFSNLNGKENVSDWAKGYMGAFISFGVIKGDENGNINSNQSIVRGEMAVISDRLVTDFITEGGVKTLNGSGIAVVATNEPVTLVGSFKGTVIVSQQAGQVSVNAKDITTLSCEGGETTVAGEADMIAVSGKANTTVLNTATVTAASADGKDATLNFNAPAESIAVNGATLNVGINGNVDTVSISGTGTNLAVSGVVGVVADDKTATDTKISAEVGADITNVTLNGTNASVDGMGNVGTVTANGANASVTTMGTVVTAGPEATGTTANGSAVETGGSTVTAGGTPIVVRPPAPTPDAVAPIILEDPAAVEIKYMGVSKTLRVEHAVLDDHNYKYQWYVNYSDSADRGTAIAGATKQEYIVPANDASTVGKTLYYYCVVTAVLGEKSASTATATAAVTVNEEKLQLYYFGEFPMNGMETVVEMLKLEQGIDLNVKGNYLAYDNEGSTTYSAYELFSEGNLSSGVADFVANEDAPLDYLVIQSGRHYTLLNANEKARNFDAICKLVEAAASINPNVQVIIMAPYAHSVFKPENHNADFGSDPTEDINIDTMAEHIELINSDAESIKNIIEANDYTTQPVKIAYVGDAFLKYSDDEAKIAADLYRPANDGGVRGKETAQRASALGAYLTACVVYNTITGQSIVGSTYLGDDSTGLHVDGVNSETADIRDALGMTPEEIAEMLQNISAQGMTTYTVEYYLQNADDDGYTIGGSKTYDAESGTYVIATPETIDKYYVNLNVPGTLLEGRVLADGSTVFTAYYDRYTFTVSYDYTNFLNNTNKPALPETEEYKWGATVTVKPDQIWEGYQFSGWETGDATVSEGTFEMPFDSNVVFFGKWSKLGVAIPSVSIDGTKEVGGLSNDSMGNPYYEYVGESDTLKAKLEYQQDLTAAGLDATEHHAAVFTVTDLIPNAPVEIVGKKNGQTEIRAFTATEQGTLDVIWGFEDGEDQLTILVYDENNDVAVETVVSVEAELFADFNVFVFGEWSMYDDNVNNDLEMMLQEIGGSVEVTKRGVSSSWTSYQSYELYKWDANDTTVCTAISNSVLKEAVYGDKKYDYFVFQLSNNMSIFKGNYITKENNGFLFLQQELINEGSDAEIILYAPNAMRQGFSESSYNMRSYYFKKADFPLLRIEDGGSLICNSRINQAEILHMRALTIEQLLNDADVDGAITVKIANVVDAFEYYINFIGEEDDLYRSDFGSGTRKYSAYRNRGNDLGAFLTANIIATTVFSSEASAINYNDAEKYGITVEQAKTLIDVADLFTGNGKQIATSSDLTFDLTSVTADGTEKPVTVAGAEGMGIITVYYNGSTEAPKNPGTYLVSVSLESGEKFGYAENITLGSYMLMGQTEGASVELTTDNEFTSGLTATGISVAFDCETITLDGTLRYNPDVKGHSIELKVTAKAGDTIVGIGSKEVTAVADENGVAIIDVPVTPAKRTVDVYVTGATSTECMTVQLADTAELTFNMLVVGDTNVSGAIMYNFKWMRDILRNEGYTVHTNHSLGGGKWAMYEVFTVLSDGTIGDDGNDSAAKIQRNDFLNAMLKSETITYSGVEYDFSTFKYDMVLIPMNRRYSLTSSSTYANEKKSAMKMAEVVYTNNPNAEIILMAGTGSYLAGDDATFGSVAVQEEKTRANAVDIRNSLLGLYSDMNVSILNFSTAINTAADDATSMAKSTTSSLALLYNQYSAANNINLGSAGAAMVYYMITDYMFELDMWNITEPSGFLNSAETGNSWTVGAEGAPIVKYWALTMNDEEGIWIY